MTSMSKMGDGLTARIANAATSDLTTASATAQGQRLTSSQLVHGFESVVNAIAGRQSVRGYLDLDVPRNLIEEILSIASRAPSGSNVQPWKVYVCSGNVKQALTADLLAAHFSKADGHKEEYDYYPLQWRDPYLARRRKSGWALYGLLGIEKGDTERMMRQHGRNYEFFGAPVGMFFTIDKDMGKGGWIEIGMFIQSVMIAAKAFGLGTCAQQAFAKFHRIVRKHLVISDQEIVVCGMALGYVDPAEPANRLVTDRMPISEFVRFR